MKARAFETFSCRRAGGARNGKSVARSQLQLSLLWLSFSCHWSTSTAGEVFCLRPLPLHPFLLTRGWGIVKVETLNGAGNHLIAQGRASSAREIITLSTVLQSDAQLKRNHDFPQTNKTLLFLRDADAQLERNLDALNSSLNREVGIVWPYLSIHPSIHPSILSIYLSVCLSVCRSVGRSVDLSVCL